jgi:hypothetical protein
MLAFTVSNKVLSQLSLVVTKLVTGSISPLFLRAAERNSFLVGRCVNLNRAQEDTWTLDLITSSSLLCYSNPHCEDEVVLGRAVITGTWTWRASCWDLLLSCVFK